MEVKIGDEEVMSKQSGSRTIALFAYAHIWGTAHCSSCLVMAVDRP